MNNLTNAWRKKSVVWFQISILSRLLKSAALPLTPLATGFWMWAFLLLILIGCRNVSQHGVEHASA
jgi:hypothetical protein